MPASYIPTVLTRYIPTGETIPFAWFRHLGVINGNALVHVVASTRVGDYWSVDTGLSMWAIYDFPTYEEAVTYARENRGAFR